MLKFGKRPGRKVVDITKIEAIFVTYKYVGVAHNIEGWLRLLHAVIVLETKMIEHVASYIQKHFRILLTCIEGIRINYLLQVRSHV